MVSDLDLSRIHEPARVSYCALSPLGSALSAPIAEVDLPEMTRGFVSIMVAPAAAAAAPAAAAATFATGGREIELIGAAANNNDVMYVLYLYHYHYKYNISSLGMYK